LKPKIVCSLNRKWNLKSKSNEIITEVEVPGTVFEALVDNELIDDPFYGENEHIAKDIFNCDWEFETQFDLKDELLSYKHLILDFRGIDTFAEVELNGIRLGTTENMFQKYDFDIKNVARKRNNTLRVSIRSPVQIAKELVGQYGVQLKTTHSIPGVPYIRKAQYSFGWDWGPELPDIGIWKDVEIKAYDDLMIESYYLDINFTYNKDVDSFSNLKEYSSFNIDYVELIISTQLSDVIQPDNAHNLKLICSIKGPDDISYEKVYDLTKSDLKIQFNIEYPYIWWTHDLGTPNLYDLNLSLYNNNELIDSYHSKFGIREVKLNRNLDKWGETFYFTLNGIPIFAKGANWVPLDSFIPRGKKLGLYERNIENSIAANMNFIRVWGGGIYEDDLFYELCDKHGILVWQDFPFACAIYPIHQKFIENVTQEAIQNIKRLRNHPSLALWCGNNELEQLWNWLLFNANLKDSELIEEYEKGYLKIFKEIIPNLIKKYDPRHQYWPSSALDKYDDSILLSTNPNNAESGDSHFWRVWHGGASFKSYRKFDSRFMSEFGFESFPSIKTIRSFCPEEDLYLDSPIMNNHQKNEGGNKKILRYMRKRFNIPKEFEKQIILSQITQAEAIQYGVEYWRQNRNEYHCMGSLYWQLNDCWPVASWSSFDYYGRWKALHYFAQRFYAPLLPSVREDKNVFEAWITNDYPSARSVNYFWKLCDNQGELLKEGFYEVEVPPCCSKRLERVDVSEFQTKLKESKIALFYGIEDQPLTNGMRLFDAPKRFKLQKPEIIWKLEEINDDINHSKYQIKIKTRSIALYIFITSKQYDFIASDNFFSMVPEEERVIELNYIKPINNGKNQPHTINKDPFNIYSLYDLIDHS
jgi:beta-mannosidase